MIPEKLRRPWFVVPVCVLSLSIGLELFFLPFWYPAVRERIIDQGWQAIVAVNGAFCIFLPVGFLFWATRGNSREPYDSKFF